MKAGTLWVSACYETHHHCAGRCAWGCTRACTRRAGRGRAAETAGGKDGQAVVLGACPSLFCSVYRMADYAAGPPSV